MKKTGYKSVDHYISTFPEEIQANLIKLRQTIKTAAPEAEEVISYQMPTYKDHGIIIYFAAFKDHYSVFVPSQGVHQAFAKELAPYKTSKATIPFPKSEPIPFDLVAKMVKFAVEENRSRKTQ